MSEKNLNIAFVWHFHQPNYQLSDNGVFVLPWARLHASKDYLSMLMKIQNFKKLKLNFSFSPILIEILEKYLSGIKDINLNILLKEESDLTKEDKIYILNNCFDLNIEKIVPVQSHYYTLYKKRANLIDFSLENFSNTEYFDIITNYNLFWFDKELIEQYDDLKYLFKKEKNYTKEDREKIYEIQLDIIKQIFEKYKKYQNENKIEIMFSPYYHPILPLLLDSKNKEIKNNENLIENFSSLQNVEENIKLAIEKYKQLFNKSINGMWLAEQCICPKTTEILAKYKINYTIADEGILAKSLKKEFIRNFDGNIENPFDLCLNYKTENKNSLNILFSNAFFAHLINFVYGNFDSVNCANDLYEKIKTIQLSLANSPNKNHIITIAMDGENCWETYQNNGNNFLNKLYELIENDETIETVLINNFLEKNKPSILKNLKSGSWINRNFDLWIGEKTKNKAWKYLALACQILDSIKTNEEIANKAKKELLSAQSSDWFWWFGEPNTTKDDKIFDYLFRKHLANFYEILNLPIPDYLLNPIED